MSLRSFNTDFVKRLRSKRAHSSLHTQRQRRVKFAEYQETQSYLMDTIPETQTTAVASETARNSMNISISYTSEIRGCQQQQ
jgi:hypothetical protein